MLPRTCQKDTEIKGEEIRDLLFDLSVTKVVNSRFFKRQNVVWRRRQTDSGVVFTTRETIDLSGVVVVKKRTPKPQPYNPGKLFISLLKSVDHLDNAEQVSWDLRRTIEHKLTLSLTEDFSETTTHIAELCLETLNAYDKTAYIKYASYQPELVSVRKLVSV